MAYVAFESRPAAINYVVGFLMVGLAWGFTTPFIRRAARSHHPPAHPTLDRADVKASWLKSKLFGTFFAVLDLLKNPRYAIPLLINLTGSVWFFLLIGKAGESRWSTACSTCRCVAVTLTSMLRAESDCSYRKHPGVSVHCSGRLVGREEGYQQR
jgi:hypothetical protein